MFAFGSTTAGTTVNVWPMWNNQWAGTGTMNVIPTAYSSMVWQSWNTAAYTPSTTSLNVTVANLVLGTWQAWNGMYLQGITITGGAPHRRTEEEEAALQAAHAVAAEANRLAHLAAEAAKLKARTLLFSFLSDEQKREAQDFKRFHLTTRSGRRYRIHMDRGRHGNVKELEGDREVRSYCIAPGDGSLPECDALLAQKLALEHDEADFLRIANMTRVA